MTYEIRTFGEVTDIETGEVYTLTPSDVEDLDNKTLELGAEAFKRFKKVGEAFENTIKKRLEKGDTFKNVKFGKPSKKTIVIDDNARKRELVIKHGWDCVVLKSPTELKKIYGNKIEDDIEDLVIIGENKPSLKWG